MMSAQDQRRAVAEKKARLEGSTADEVMKRDYGVGEDDGGQSPQESVGTADTAAAGGTQSQTATANGSDQSSDPKKTVDNPPDPTKQ